MPIATFSRVFCCSSEDKAHPASNLLLNTDANKKWKCNEKGTRSILVVLAFEKPTRIVGLDIGNEHSAFVEAFVGRNGWNHEDFKQILLTSSFMTPLESRDSSIPNRVRCFGASDLLAPFSAEKWDFLKLVCVQPFNRYVQFGLAFVKVHSMADDDGVPAPQQQLEAKPTCGAVLGLPANNVFARFRMRGDSSDSDKDCPSSLFQQSQQKQLAEKETTSSENE